MRIEVTSTALTTKVVSLVSWILTTKGDASEAIPKSSRVSEEGWPFQVGTP